MNTEFMKGVVVPILTVIDGNEKVDEAGMRDQVEYVIKGGVSGILAFGSNGEFYMVEEDEMERGLRIMVDQAAGRVPVYFGIGAISTKKCCRLARMAVANGAAAVSVLQPMFLNSVKPWLAAMSDSVLHSVTLRVTGVGESHLESRIGHLLENANPTAAVYAKTAEVVIRITAKAASENEARRMCLDYAKHFYDILGDCVYAMDADSLEEVVVKELAARGLTVATAESCTGGMLSQRITAVPGASGVFAYGACTYANDIKEKMLGVRHETLEAYGAVSPETAAEMARGVRKAAGADFGVGITGIAGPGGGTPEKPVGLVYLAACSADTVYVQKLVITGRTREVVRLSSTQHALEMVRRLALGLPQPACTAFPAEEPAHLMQKGTPARDV